MTLYLDASALVKLYLDEAHRDIVIEAVAQADRVAICSIGYAELASAFARKLRNAELTDDEYDQASADLERDWPRLLRVIVDDALAKHAGRLSGQYRLRALDALHLAAAVDLHRAYEDVTFLGYDEALNQAAADLIPLYTPERRNDAPSVRRLADADE